MLFFTNFLTYKNKTPPSCYLDGATEIILLKLIAVVNNTSPVSSPAL